MPLEWGRFQDCWHALAGWHQVRGRPAATLLKNFPPLADILEIPVTIKGYEIIPMRFDFGDVTQNEFALFEILALFHQAHTSRDISLQFIYIGFAISVPTFLGTKSSLGKACQSGSEGAQSGFDQRQDAVHDGCYTKGVGMDAVSLIEDRVKRDTI